MNSQEYWPEGKPKKIHIPEKSLTELLMASTVRTPGRTALIFYGAEYSYCNLLHMIERLSGYLQSVLGVRSDEPILLVMQNSPQFFISFYAIMHAGGVVVPINPMSRSADIAYIQNDTEARIILCGGEVCEYAVPLLIKGRIEQLIVSNYADMAAPDYDLKVPDTIAWRDPDVMRKIGCTVWQDVITASSPSQAVLRSVHDPAVIPYSYGTTGDPKGCMHSHYTVISYAVRGATWHEFDDNSISLTTLPMHSVFGMQTSMIGPIYAGGKLVVMIRWEPQTAAELIYRYNVTHWRSTPKMAIDLVKVPNITQCR